MADVVTSYFQNLFTVEPSLQADPVVNLIDARVNEPMNDRLCADFSEKEISDALYQISPLMAPGPDGFLARVFQRNWVVMKLQVIAGVKEFFRTGVMPRVLGLPRKKKEKTHTQKVEETHAALARTHHVPFLLYFISHKMHWDYKA